MVLKIDRVSDGQSAILRLSGHLRSEELVQLKAQMEANAQRLVLNLAEVKLVDWDVVGFLGECEAHGITLEQCPRYVRDWIDREKNRNKQTNAGETMAIYFFAKLIPPRPSFAFDMSVAERALMQEHGAYWSRIAVQGQAVVFGPVADPNGPFGLLVLEVETEDDAQRLIANDPVNQSGLNFRFETYPMLSAVTRRSMAAQD